MGALTRGAIVAVAIAAMGVGCRCSNSSPGTDSPDSAPVASAQPQRDEILAVRLLDRIPTCVIQHRGVLLDLGSAAADGHFDYSIAPAAGIENVELEGATWARVTSRSLSQRFVLDRDTPVFVQLRVHGASARSASVSIDDKPVGAVRLGKDDSTVVSTATTADPIPGGPHVLTVQFHGVRKGQVAADVDWIRVGFPDNDGTTFAAPTQRDLIVDASIRGQPRRALALRAPGSVRCQVPIPERAVLRAQIGYAGPGEGEAEIVMHEPGQPPAVLQTAKVGGESESAVDVELPLDSFAGRWIDLELRATSTTPGGRVLFGEPGVFLPKPGESQRAPAQVAIVLVFSGTSPSQLPPYTDVPALATLTDLAAASVAFQHHRTTSSLASASIASLFTGFPPSTHMLIDSGARLSARVPTVGTMARDGRVTTAMFTGNPTTFEAFGFNRGWDRFAAFSPVSGDSPRAPLIEASKWIEKRLEEARDGRLLVVIHARGVHPPWSATTEEIRSLPPEEYSGPIEARRGAQILAAARSRNNPRLKPADRERIDGFCALSMVGEDQSLSQLLAVLRKARVWDKTLLVVTSDVALGAASRVPFGEGTDLGEDLLDLPLLVRFPGGRYAGKTVATATSPSDVLTTVLAALQLKPPEEDRGRDLFEVATHPGRFEPSPQVAELGSEYATRLGDFLLRGTSPRTPSLCLLNAMAECGDDLATARPFLDSYLFESTYRHFQDATKLLDPPLSREPATLDPDTVAALTVWGNLEPR